MFVRIATTAAVAVAMSTAAVARDYVSMAGSSTVFPFATIVLWLNCLSRVMGPIGFLTKALNLNTRNPWLRYIDIQFY